MFRNLLGLVLGMTAGFAAIYGWQWIGHWIFPFPGTPTDPGKREALAYMSFAAKLWVIGGYPVGAAAGGLLGNWIADARWPAVLIAVSVAGAFLVTLTAAPHPFWMQIAGLALPVVAGLVVAAAVGRKTFPKPAHR